MSQSASSGTDGLLDKIDTLAVNDEDAQEEFVEAALDEARSMLTENLSHVPDADETPENVLNPKNVRSIDTENPDYRNPRMRIWLKKCPKWANTSQKREFYVGSVNERNSKVNAIIDVRPH